MFRQTNGALRRGIIGAACIMAVSLASGALAPQVEAAGGEVHIERQDWSFAGVFGHYDRAQLQRGFQVYKEVCSSCHSMNLLSYRNLGQPGGPQFSEAAVKALAAEVTVVDGFDDAGDPVERPGKPADRFVAPFPNEAAARASNNGALPPDLSLIAKARSSSPSASFAPVAYAKDIVSGYQEGGPDYVHALLTGYVEAPDDFELAEGMNYNAAFPGHQIAMAQPIYPDQVTYTDGTPTTVEQMSLDVSAFLMWAAEPTLEERKQLGLRVMLYLVILAFLLYLAKRKVWSRIEH